MDARLIVAGGILIGISSLLFPSQVSESARSVLFLLAIVSLFIAAGIVSFRRFDPLKSP